MDKPTLETAVEEIMEVKDDICTEWEWHFIEDIEEKLEQGWSLSERQEEVVWKIHKRACDSNL